MRMLALSMTLAVLVIFAAWPGSGGAAAATAGEPAVTQHAQEVAGCPSGDSAAHHGSGACVWECAGTPPAAAILPPRNAAPGEAPASGQRALAIAEARFRPPIGG